MTSHDRKSYRYVDDQLAVDLEDQHLIGDVIHDLGIKWQQKAKDEALGLALLELHAPAASMKRLADEGSKWQGVDWRAVADEVQRDGYLPNSLDTLLCGLRKGFQKAYGGWNPSMGKVRRLERVTSAGGRPPGGEPHIGGDGEVRPLGTRAAAFTIPPSTDPNGPRIGILDTAIAPLPSLAGRYVATSDALLPDELVNGTKEDELPRAFEGHATFLAGVILQRAPDARLEVRSVPFDRERETADIWNVATRLVQFAGSGVKLVNMSLCCWTRDNRPPFVLQRAIERLGSELLVVAAAGNLLEARWGNDQMVFPGAMPGVLAVGSDDQEGSRAAFSPDAPWVNLQAPGENLASTYLIGEVREQDNEIGGPFWGSACWNGTSFSAGIVTAALASSGHAGPWDVQTAIDLATRSGIADHIRTFP
jgi:subtilisin family serine protease